MNQKNKKGDKFTALDINELVGLCLDNTKEGILVCSREWDILYCNDRAVTLLISDREGIQNNLKNAFLEEDFFLLSQNHNLTLKNLEIRLIPGEKNFCIILNDLSAETKMAEKLEKIKQLNRELQFMLEQYSDDTIYIADANGNTLYAGEGVAQNCGVKSSFLKGKNVADLEKKGIFNPSVTLKVLESKQPEVVIQNTLANRRIISFGTPIFNGKNELTKVVSISRDISQQINNGTLISQLGEEKSLQDSLALYPDFVTCSETLHDVVELVKIISSVNSTVLISGETGTGKDVIARMIHKLSMRSDQAFIKVNCGAIAPNLVESELFGYETGAFTGANKQGKVGLIEAAHGGTLFLDEISELPLNQQVKLLQVLQERRLTRVGSTKTVDVDIRVIAASNRSLEKMVAEGQFREDLFYRLNVLPINIPSLRDRKGDIALLTKHFLKRFNVDYAQNKKISKEALAKLSAYKWPGNVRELENMIERLVITTKENVISADDLPVHILKSKIDPSINGDAVAVNEIIPLNTAIEETEKKLIQMALGKYGTALKAAEVLQVNQSTVSRKMQKYKLGGKKSE